MAASANESSIFVLTFYRTTIIAVPFCVGIYVLVYFCKQRTIQYGLPNSSSNSIGHKYSDRDTSSLCSEDCKEISSQEFLASCKFCMKCEKRGKKCELMRCTTCEFTTLHPRYIRDATDEHTLDFTYPDWVCALCVQRFAFFYQLLLN